MNPTAYDGRENTIKDPDLRALAWLGNLNYWCQLSLLDASYRHKSKPDFALAEAIMMGPLMSLAQYLPTKGSAVPFDPLSMGFEPALNAAAGKRFTHRMLEDPQLRPLDRAPVTANFNLNIYDQLLAAM